MSFEGIPRQPKREEEPPDQVAELAVAAERLERRLEERTLPGTEEAREEDPQLGEPEPDFGDIVRKFRERG